ncbi:E3 binding domain protein [Deinococcus proteolyticus MRP]|uniref:E3 binding domain protein n=1 Tax=Deinococcus proteolyticus (strain ATCC 35074 / DSM 20540 / JCM 6276 / NBRC 101906 / NCIMB 13154 / VKM Ac-1939 / CCM 2703 / MRP) TaxID=693977 RepID=F0RIY0_DEIPM|nr:E3 binding domain-containing protein [Deinococcus proteolyticus]ADY25239.1 E3 binding domain protein [Deinococcus proteolyticus MRP]
MDNISPLAKTLAESNGIDWRAIQGSGAGGQIVEQDIINYLTRVMSGEEEPPATPVDLPPPDWTGDELPAGMSAEMLSQAGVESDIAALVNQAPLAQAPASQQMAQDLSSQGATLEEDEFELDLEDEPAAPVAAEPVSTEPVVTNEVAPAPAASQPAATGGLGGLLSQLYQSPASQAPAPQVPAPQAPEVAATPAYGQPAGFSQGGTGQGGYDRSAYGQSDDGQGSSEPAYAEQTAPQTEQTAVQDTTEPAYAQAEATQPTASDALRFTDSQDAAGDIRQQAAEPAVAAVSEVSSQSADVETAASAAVETAVMVPAPAEQPEQAAPALAAPAPAAPAARPEQAVWFGVYLRRDADLQAASNLRDQLNAALGQDVPFSLLVARAAQQHAGMLNLSAVAIQDVYSHRARSVGAPGAGLRDALSAIDRDHEGGADLLVVNAGTFDLDELHYPDAVTLSLGRVVDGRAALSLNGNVDTAQAAEFLAAVAGSLEAPVSLIV